jgi:hypothetical protein
MTSHFNIGYCLTQPHVKIALFVNRFIIYHWNEPVVSPHLQCTATYEVGDEMTYFIGDKLVVATILFLNWTKNTRTSAILNEFAHWQNGGSERK